MFNPPSRIVLFALAFPLMISFLGRDCGRQQKDGKPTVESGSNKMDSAKIGTWSGEHISLEVTSQGAEVEYDCAHGMIDQKIVADDGGHFDLRGTHIREHGGPIRKDEREDRHPARYTGQLTGDTMTLTVTESDTGQSVGTFTLTFGRPPHLTKCR
jgi:hypothetical protein